MPYDPHQLMAPYLRPLSEPFQQGMKMGQNQAQFEQRLGIERDRLNMMAPYYQSLTEARNLTGQKTQAELDALSQSQEQRNAQREWLRLKGYSNVMDVMGDPSLSDEEKMVAAKIFGDTTISRKPAEPKPYKPTIKLEEDPQSETGYSWISIDERGNVISRNPNAPPPSNSEYDPGKLALWMVRRNAWYKWFMEEAAPYKGESAEDHRGRMEAHIKNNKGAADYWGYAFELPKEEEVPWYEKVWSGQNFAYPEATKDVLPGDIGGRVVRPRPQPSSSAQPKSQSSAQPPVPSVQHQPQQPGGQAQPVQRLIYDAATGTFRQK